MTTRKDETKTLDLEQFAGHTSGEWKPEYISGICTGISVALQAASGYSYRQRLFNTILPNSDKAYKKEGKEIEANVSLAAAAPQLLARCRELSTEVERLKAAQQDNAIAFYEYMTETSFDEDGIEHTRFLAYERDTKTCHVQHIHEVDVYKIENVYQWFVAERDRHLSPATDHSPKQS